MTETRRPLANASTMLAVVCLTVGLVGTAMLLVPADWRPHFTVSLLCPSNIPQGQPLHITVLTAGRDGLNTKRDLTVEMALENRRDYRIVHQGQQVIPTSVHYELPTNELLPDRYLVRVSIDGIEPIESAFRVGDPPSAYAIRLQTDRPRYQPGQSIRVRSVVTKDGKPTGNEKVTLSIVDDKGTRLLGKELMTSSFGVAATEFNLASELRLGDYKVVAESSQGIKESLPVTIDRYVLPAFLVDLKLDKRGLGDSHYLINGIVSTRHPTAGPILDCTVEVSAWIRASRLFPKQSAKGRTDKRGEFAFTFDLDQLPRFASGNNDAVIELQVTATVTDPTGHSEEVSKSISIPPFKEPFQIFVIPEQGVLKQGIDNKVTLICCDSSGNPVQAEVVADSDAGSFSGRTSPFGAVTGSIRPDASDCQIRITGETAKQEKFEKTFDLVATSPEDRLALRFDRLEIPKDGNVTLRAKGLEVGADAVLEIRSFVSNRQLYAQHFTATKITEEFSLTAEDWPVGVVVAGLWQPSPAGAARLGEASALVAGESGLQTRLKLAASQVAPGEVNHLKIEATSVDGNPVRGVAGVCITDVRNTREEAAKGFSWNRVFSQVSRRDLPVDLEDMPPWLRRVHAKPEPLSLSGVVPEGDTLALVALLDAIASDVAPMWLEKKYDSKDPLVAWQKSVWKEIASGAVFILGLVLFFLGLTWLLRISDTRKPLHTAIVEAVIVGFIILFLIAISLPNFLEAQIRVSAPIETPSLVGEPTRFTLQGVIGETVAIRERFPETLLWLPEVVLDASGQAEVGIPPADSITQWNIEVRTHEGEGRFGRASEMFAIHKDLVVEPDLPIFMYEGDEIEIPVRVSNHSSESLSVSLEAEVEGGLEPIDPGWERRMEVSPGEIGVTSFRVSAARPESATITLVGRSDLIFDAVKRALRILPFSESREKVITRRVKGVWQEEIPLPEDAIPGTIHGEVALALTSTALIEKSLPTLEHLLRKPYGCFEQTSSVAYPNALVLRLADELGFGDRGFHERAKQLVLESYQRLLTFEVSCGGFSLFGKKPASPPLSALGLSEFSEMDGLISVDRAITERTAGYLSQTLKPSVLSETDLAYTSAAVAAVKSGEYIPSWLREHVRNVIPLETDPYRLGLWIEALGALSSEEPLLNSGRERLISMVSSDGDLRWWSASDRTVMGSRGSYADIEATAVAIQALAHTGPGIELLSGAEEWLIAKMSSDGSWGTTQATVQALRALIALSRLNRGADSCKVKVMQGDSLTEVYLDSHHPQTTFPLAIQDETGCFLSIQQDDQAPLITRILISYRVRWDKSAHNREGPMEMTFISPTIEACRGQTIQTTLELAWNGTEKGETPLVSVPLPAGFRFSSTGKADLECIKEVQKVQATGEAVHIYLADMEPGARVSLPVDLTVDFAGTFNTPPIEAHLYYQPNMRVRAVHDCWVTFDTRNQ